MIYTDASRFKMDFIFSIYYMHRKILSSMVFSPSIGYAYATFGNGKHKHDIKSHKVLFMLMNVLGNHYFNFYNSKYLHSRSILDSLICRK